MRVASTVSITASDVLPCQLLSLVAQQYISAAISDATRRAYQGDLADFHSWGGSVPSNPVAVAEYVASRGRQHSSRTIARRVVGIGRAHTTLGFPDPSKSDLVRAVLRGLRRTEILAARKALPLLREDIFPMLEQMAGIKGARDRALILIGFAGAFRRSELVGLNCEDLRFVKEGLLVRVVRSKTDQAGEGHEIAIPFGRTHACPVKAIQQWLDIGNIEAGAVFRGVTKAGLVSSTRLSDQSVSLIVKGYARLLGLPAKDFSGHSLRAGLVTSAAKAGVSFAKIQQQTGHRSIGMLMRYVRDAQVFENNAAGLLL